MIILFKTPMCPRCSVLQKFLESLDAEFNMIDLSQPEGLTELYAAGVYTTEAPVLFTDGVYLMAQDLFKGNVMNEAVVRQYTGKL
jgi:glutaredoxin